MNFKDFNLNQNLTKALDEINFTIATKIQKQTIPLILDKKNILAISKTGSGKTLAFSLPILQLLESNTNKLSAIILVPTRELVNQIYKNIKEYSKYIKLNIGLIHAGLDLEEQENTLKNKPQLLITTPNKLRLLLEQKQLSIENLDYLVLDEADKIIELGANVDLKYIFKKAPYNLQIMLFSATFDSKIEELVENFQKDFIKVQIKEEQEKQNIQEFVYYVDSHNKNKLLLDLINKKELKSSIIFTNSKLDADNLVRFLTENNIKSEALHSAKSDTHRTKVINNIQTRKIKYLIATDLAARGLDIDNITHVINYQIPQNPQIYTHRKGRVGRAEKIGISISLCSLDDRNYFRKIEQNNKIKMQTSEFHSNVVLNAKPKDAKPQQKKIEHTINKKRLKSKFAKPSKKSKRL